MTAQHLRRTIRQLGLIQIDSVNVLLPAHYQVPFSRLGPYRRSLLDDLVYRRREFTEQWAHEASIVSVDAVPLLRRRYETHDRRLRALAAFMQKHADYAGRVLDDIRSRGPITASDLPEPNGERGRRGDWWGWTIAKATLEGHFASGTLAIAQRRVAGFARVYDLAERVVPDEHRRREVSRDEALRELLRRAARSLGVATAHDLADYYRIPIRIARTHIAELVETGELTQLQVEGWRDAAYLHPQASCPKRIEAAALLSPFDPVVWFRPRVLRLFGFDYRIEVYVPRPQRRWGYYVLPFLLDDRLVARVDLKADRGSGKLQVQAAHIEPGVSPALVAPPLAAELGTMARWLELDSVAVVRRGNVARQLAAEVRARRGRTR
ncbi:MAG TPA: crosslink repair DNA glycosylase YcaQ family protein [Gemmatimonadaceae bacterium]|nr:crosslink repair DNA glycosylase YcaQ family protein [Gemmatimonadaceae bacterium]